MQIDAVSTAKKVLASLDASPAKILEVLSLHPVLSVCYAKSAGVSEGYTVGEHTQMVLEKAQEFRECLREKVGAVVTWDEFLLFLALHDIGKDLAKNQQSEAFGTCLSFKEAELRTTRTILSETMEMLGVPVQNICLFCEMLAL